MYYFPIFNEFWFSRAIFDLPESISWFCAVVTEATISIHIFTLLESLLPIFGVWCHILNTCLLWFLTEVVLGFFDGIIYFFHTFIIHNMQNLQWMYMLHKYWLMIELCPVALTHILFFSHRYHFNSYIWVLHRSVWYN
jgi:hypothetical protein